MCSKLIWRRKLDPDIDKPPETLWPTFLKRSNEGHWHEKQYLGSIYISKAKYLKFCLRSSRNQHISKLLSITTDVSHLNTSADLWFPIAVHINQRFLCTILFANKQNNNSEVFTILLISLFSPLTKIFNLEVQFGEKSQNTSREYSFSQTRRKENKQKKRWKNPTPQNYSGSKPEWRYGSWAKAFSPYFPPMSSSPPSPNRRNEKQFWKCCYSDMQLNLQFAVNEHTK